MDLFEVFLASNCFPVSNSNSLFKLKSFLKVDLSESYVIDLDRSNILTFTSGFVFLCRIFCFKF